MGLYPFKFLDSYNREDVSIFFGRETEIEELFQMVVQSPVVLVYGPSGTGKTSLIQCGLSCRFQEHEWLPISIRRGKNINNALEEALRIQNVPLVSDELEWLNEFSNPVVKAKQKETAGLIVQSLNAIYRNVFKPIYLIFDQLEELFIFGSKAEQKQFIRTIAEIVAVQQPVRIIFSIREEYLGELFDFENSVPLLRQKKLRIESMGPEKVTEVIDGMTNQNRVKTNVSLKQGEEQKIIDKIFKLVKGDSKERGIQLSYLQVLLDKVYLDITQDESRKKEAEISLTDIDSIENIGDVLRSFLEDQVRIIHKELASTYPTLTLDNIWQILSQFVTLKGTKEPVSKQLLQEKLPDFSPQLLNDVIERLVSSRILRYSESNDLYEIAHDTLGPTIASKRSEEEIAILEVRKLIESQCSFKGDARFFREEQMSFINSILPKIKLSPAEQQLIDESNVEIGRRKGRKRRRFVIVTVSVAIAFLALSGLFIYSLQQKRGKSIAEAAMARQTHDLDSIRVVQAEIQARTGQLSSRFKEDSIAYTNRLNELTDSVSQTIQASQKELKAMSNRFYYSPASDLISYLASNNYDEAGVKTYYKLIDSSKGERLRRDYISTVRNSIAESRDLVFKARALCYLFNATRQTSFLEDLEYLLTNNVTSINDQVLIDVDVVTNDFNGFTDRFRLRLFERLVAERRKGNLNVKDEYELLDFFSSYHFKGQGDIAIDDSSIFLPYQVLQLTDISNYFYAMDIAIEAIDEMSSNDFSPDVYPYTRSLFELNKLIGLCKLSELIRTTNNFTDEEILRLLPADYSGAFYSRLNVPPTRESSAWEKWEAEHETLLYCNSGKRSRFEKKVENYWMQSKIK